MKSRAAHLESLRHGFLVHAAQCKHQLAARIAQALQRFHTQVVPDEVLAEVLLAT